MEATIKKPSLFLLALESRVGLEIAAHLAFTPYYKTLPSGNGRTVLVIPGFGSNDSGTALLRQFLKRKNYHAVGWGLGTNNGSSKRIREALFNMVANLHNSSDEKVTIIGWSLGGLYARELGRKFPDHVHSVITLGTPFTGDPDANNVSRIVNFFSKKTEVPKVTSTDAFREKSKPLPVPSTAIFSKTDGIVAWQCSLEQEAVNTQNIAVISSHLGLPFNPLVMRAIAKTLANF